jgi:serine/threonine-protein kinase
MAPEAISDPKKTGQRADIWSVGAMLYELLSGERPYGSGLAAVPKILVAAPPPKPKVSYSLQFKPLAKALYELVSVCLVKDPNARPTADDLVKRCGELCYPISEREVGMVKSIHYKSWGFITPASGSDIFFHLDSVYGKRPTVGDYVCYCSFPGGEAPRAHPVVVLRQP